ncbi:MAG: sensor domain-containing diguanylate cyclase [Spirochaetales bacterium]|nr:sensor domain-containing diguanylate cyclase [Spirochaetales bacterium]
MNIPLIIATYTAAASIVISIIRMLRQEGASDPIHKIYYTAAVFTLAWCLSYLAMYLTTDLEIAAAAYKAGAVGWTANFSVLFLLCIRLLQTISGRKISPVPGYVAILTSLIFFAAALTGKIFATGFVRMNGGWWAERTCLDDPWVIAYLVWTSVIFITALIPLFSLIKIARLRRHRRQIIFIFVPFIILTLITIIINLIVPLTGRSKPPLGHILISSYIVFIGYTILRFRVTTPDPEIITGPLLFQISDMVILTDTRGTILRANQAVSSLLGYDTDTLVSRELSEILPGIIPLKEAADEREAVRNSGEKLPVHCTVTPIDDVHGDRIGFFLLLKDLTQLKMMEELSVTDSLTGIFNRNKLRNELTQELLRSRRYGSVFSLILFDVDHFKVVNDTYGHGAGDAVLRNLSDAVRMIIRDTDLFSRWGGEEFLILCVNTHRDAAGQLAEKIRSRLETIDHPGVGRVTASFGVTAFLESDTEDSIIERVDKAMYDAKHRGRNTTSVF